MKAIFLISLFLCAGIIAASPLDHFGSLWSAWKHRHNKAYTGAENKARFAIFVQNVEKIIKNNAEKNGITFAINQFADLTSAEFKKAHTGGLRVPKQSNKKTVSLVRSDPLPDNVDWRVKGSVTPVKDQGNCGSCWAFSATGALEGLYFNQNQKLLSFSEQLFVDCVTKDDGCDGGWMDDAFEYSAEKGVETEDDYPYKARDQTCKYDKSKSIKVNSDFYDVPENNSTELKAAIAQAPTAVAIEADQLVFQFYKTGVIIAGCGADLDHGVLAVGYTQTAMGEAFIVKNSWGKSWGNNGYVLIGTANAPNQGQGVCGILAAASYPTGN